MREAWKMYRKIHELMAFFACLRHQPLHNTAVLLLSKQKLNAFQALHGPELECSSATADLGISKNLADRGRNTVIEISPFSKLIQNQKQLACLLRFLGHHPKEEPKQGPKTRKG